MFKKEATHLISFIADICVIHASKWPSVTVDANHEQNALIQLAKLDISLLFTSEAIMAKNNKKSWYSDKDSFCGLFKGPIFALYLNFFLSAWGDWMWQFAAGLYLVILSGGLLRLAAIFGFTCGTLMLIFGGIIGDWVDRNGRMKVVVISLFLQNLCVACCATSVCLAIKYEVEINAGLDGHLRPMVEAIIISLALMANLSSMAYKIAIEKDWIVVVASGNRGLLSNLNAVTRAIDLSCKILAPTVAGILMSYSLTIAAVCIAMWNVISVFCEYALLHRVYKLVPTLAFKGEKEAEETEMKDISGSAAPMNPDSKDDLEKPEAVEANEINETTPLSNETSNEVVNSTNLVNGTAATEKSNLSVNSEDKTGIRWLKLMAQPFVTIGKGWKTYMRQRVVFAGLSLAFLYMTVLGFDSVTTGYIYANGVKESYVGVSMAAAGVTGIIGTFIFSRINRHLGLERTGLIAFNAEIFCLALTVASIWAPGSAFNPSMAGVETNCTHAVTEITPTPTPPSLALDATTDHRQRRDLRMLDVYPDGYIPFADIPTGYSTYGIEGFHSIATMPKIIGPNSGFSRNKRGAAANSSAGVTPPSYTTESSGNSTIDDGCTKPGGPTVSIILFLVGIVTSRVGLWMADLVVTQLLQENVVELERGIVNGVQNSLNRLNDMIKFALVIALPSIETFGILILLSYLFICMAGGHFVMHVWKIDKDILKCKYGCRKIEGDVAADTVEVKVPEAADDNKDIV